MSNQLGLLQSFVTTAGTAEALQTVAQTSAHTSNFCVSKKTCKLVMTLHTNVCVCQALLHTRCTNVCCLNLQAQHSAVQAELEGARRECTTLAAAAEEAAELKERLSAARSAAAAAKQAAQKEAFQLQAQVTLAAFLL